MLFDENKEHLSLFNLKDFSEYVFYHAVLIPGDLLLTADSFTKKWKSQKELPFFN
jgi:hypothetical protein